MANNQSTIDPSRKTVGAIYRDASINNKEAFVVNGDLTHELMKSLVDDLNNTIASNPFDGKEFYITVYEKKDLLMPRAILRRLYVTKYRPYPEDDTVVFYVEPKSNTVRFCWCLPHVNEMNNMLANEGLYNQEMIQDIQAWKRHDLKHFGFNQVEGKVFSDLNPSDRKLKKIENYTISV
ncbi:MAG TPA: hypothetical protein VGK47_14905 [Nitrososphaeraceae archaeon]